MNSKNKLTVITATIISMSFLFFSCNKNDVVDKPAITLEELGAGNSYQAEVNDDLHVEAEIVAEGKIKTVSIEIHMEDGSNVIIDTTYNEFEGLRNATFHKHVEIPANAVLGEYHFHLSVVDMEGYSTTIEKEINIIENDGIDNEEE